MKHTLLFHPSRLTLWLVAVLALACRSTPTPARGAVPAASGVSAVLIAPFGFQWEEPDWRALALSQRLVGVAQAQAGEAALFFGPTDVRVPRTGDARLTGDAVALLASRGVRPEDALLLRPWAERRGHAGERELMDTRGHSVGQRATEVVMYVGHVEVLHPATQDVVLEVFGEATMNPDADIIDEGADPTPELTLLMEELTREALRGLSSHGPPPRAPARPPTLARARLAPVPVDARVQQPSGRIVPLVLP
ncbi:hypothetical protein A176_001979 [Myxococcus hansupus]|uniref:Lipoprotein n=1 Tax=Pseudomyxococcus hansupus TaxID=1297742 RepID=A0A0H4XB20_9BACT|nr:hypothetical protein [Myxococcus hansupus]AKQ65067.1 hypothetical protein A176_001979 [Myxococcus hansupus]